MKRIFLLLPILFLIPLFETRAQSIDLLWQGDGYTPPFYQGASAWPAEGRIHFLAIPQGLGDPKGLTYKWTRDGTVLGSLSGVGQSTLTFNDSILSKTQRVKVEIISPDNEALAQTSVTVTPTIPTTLIYEKNPLYGFMFHNETSNGYQLLDQEITFTAFPLFASVSNRESSALHYTWKSSAGEDSLLSSVTYRIPDGASGIASISLSLSNANTLRQAAGSTFLVQFGNPNE